MMMILSPEEMRIAHVKFLTIKRRAKGRGIPFLMSFTEWWGVWQASGKWHERGRRRDQYCMARHGPDIGPYKIGNVKIVTNSQNGVEQKTRRGRGLSEEARARIGVGIHASWQRRKQAAMSINAEAPPT
jgi:hypothetical protein